MTLLPLYLVHVGLLGMAVCEITDMTTTLGMVRGTVIKPDTSRFPSHPNVNVFYGIPFAKPPVGELRFKKPVAAESWTGLRDATTPPFSCWQALDTAFGSFPGADMWNPNTNRSEDCLYLNVWVPATSAGKAIMVWIFGGGFWSGTNTLDTYDAIKLAAANDIVVVSINYRLGPFGFLYTGDDNAPGNMGLLDQVMALQWVKDNALNMAGDPERITLFGESAGGASVGFHYLSPMSRDLFTNGIMMSGSPLVSWGIQDHDKAKKRAAKLSQTVGCPASGMKAIVDCLRTKDAEELANQQWTLVEHYFDVPIGPVVGSPFFPKHPAQLLKEGNVKNSSVMAGVVKDEGTFWVLYGFPDIFDRRESNPVNSSQFQSALPGLLSAVGYTGEALEKLTALQYYYAISPDERTNFLDVIDDISGDTLFKCAVVDFARQFSDATGAETYVYSFEHRDSTNPWPQWLGVAHGYEIATVFGQPLNQPAGTYTAQEEAFSTKVMEAFTDFAKTGDPNTASVTWPKYTSSSENYVTMEVGKFSQKQGLRHRACTFWRDYVPLLQHTEATNKDCPDSAHTLTLSLPAVTVCVLAILVQQVYRLL